MIFRLFCISLFYTALLSAEKKWQYISWDTPPGWEQIEMGHPNFPYTFKGKEKRKISLFMYEYRNDSIWILSKVYREELGLPLLTEEELQENQTLLDNGVVIHEFETGNKLTYCAFYRQYGFLWILKYSGLKESSGSAVKALRYLAESFKSNPEFTAHINELLKKKDGAKAQLQLSDYYEYGIGVPKDPKKAFELLLSLHEKGVLEATHKLSLRFLDVGKVSQAFSLLQKGVEGRHLPSIKKMATLFLEYKRDTIESHSLLKQAAEMGDTESMYYLGSLYSVDAQLKDEKAAYKWIKMAADKGWLPASRQMGVFYRSGFGVEMDIKKAVSILETTAAKGDVQSYEVLAEIYRSGELDGKKDYVKCRDYLLKAALKGSQRALVLTAQLYLYGEGVEKNPSKAVSLLKQASEKGLVEADVLLGDLYSLGKDVEENLTGAYNHYKIAAEAGDKRGMFKLGQAYLSGKGCEKNGSAGVNWLKKSAKLGYAPAIFALKDTGF